MMNIAVTKNATSTTNIPAMMLQDRARNEDERKTVTEPSGEKSGGSYP